MRIEHIAIWCKDIEAVKMFYENYFNAVPSQKYANKQKGFSSYFLTFDSGARLELMHMDSVPANANDPYTQFTGLTHLAISVGSDDKVDQLTSELKQAGHLIIDGPRRTGDGYYESVVLDIEGNRIEITA